MSLIATGLLANHKQDADLALLKALAEAAGSLPTNELVERFASYNGFLFPEPTRVIVAAIRERCRRDALADPATAVTMSGRVHDDLLALLGLENITYFVEGPAESETSWRLLNSCVNAHQSEELPRPISRLLALANCPAFDFHAVTHATLYVGPNEFQLFNAEHAYFIPGASLRPHTTSILGAPSLTINRPIVLIQDIFNGYNFAHFLLDWMTRLAIFTTNGPIRGAECLFVLGGLPVEFHRIVLNAAGTLLGLDEENFFFPTTDVLIRGTGYIGYFSDQCTPCGHPAQMCRPEAIAWIDRLARAIGREAEPGDKKLYISRSDVGRRAVANEAELFESLEARGFEFVRLGDLSVADQLSVMRSADTVVAGHGMGLTHLALHTGSNIRLVELHSPVEGTDAYAFVCKGKGFEYAAVMGEIVEGTSHFRVDPSEVVRALGHARSPMVPRSPRENFIMDPRSQLWHPGCQSTVAVTTTDIVPPFPDCAVLKHVRDAASRVHDTNVGWWQLEMLQPLKVYTFSCWVYIPAQFGGDRVTLSVGEPRERTVEADLSRRSEWLLLSMTLMPGHEIAGSNLVLRVNSGIDAVIYSSTWSVNQAPSAGSHVIIADIETNSGEVAPPMDDSGHAQTPVFEH